MPDVPVAPGPSCLTNPRTQLVYSSVGFSDFPNGWLNASGNWSKTGNEVTQTNSANSFAWISHAITSNGGNYRIVATMRSIDVALGGGSIGIVFRLGQNGGGNGGNSYSCTLDTRAETLGLLSTTSQVDVLISSRPVPLVDPMATYTMEIDATGSALTCCVRGVMNATVGGINTLYANGNAGVATRDAEGAFGSFWAYQ